MLKKTLLVVAVIVVGLVLGYYYRPIYAFVWSDGVANTVGLLKMDKEPEANSNSAAASSSAQYISADQAIAAVKALPFVNTLSRVSELERSSIDITTEQNPTAAYPVWLVEVKQRYSEKVPETMYVQVDAVSGEVLDLQKDELKLAGITLSMTRQEVLDILGRAPKTKKAFDKDLGQNVRTDTYEGLAISYNNKSRVIRIKATGEERQGPRKVKIGDIKKEIISRFGKADSAPTNLLIYDPIDEKNMQLVIKFNDEGKAEEMVIEKPAGE